MRGEEQTGMINQNEFLKQLEDLLEYAKAKESKISKKEIQEYFSEMELNEEQLNLVYAYMAEHNVEVSGFQEEKKEEKMTAEDSRYLKIYRKEINSLPVRDEEAMKEIYIRMSAGDESIKAVAVESHLKRVITIASKYKNRGVLLEDLIQEGNIALIEAVDRLCAMEEEVNHKKEIDRAIRAHLIQLVDEVQAESGMENTILAKTNLLHEATKVLAEDLGRLANIHELAEYTKMEEEEIAEFAELSLDKIEIGACHHEHH